MSHSLTLLNKNDSPNPNTICLLLFLLIHLFCQNVRAIHNTFILSQIRQFFNCYLQSTDGAMATRVAEPPLPPSTPTAPNTYTYPPVIIILTIILLIFFCVGFFSIYFCRCFLQNLLCTWHFWRSSNNTPAGGAALSVVAAGLDPSIVESFPSFPYSTVKEYRKEKYGLECAICLVEFHSSDILRLLTICCHVFHQECIDLWLESHKTCPVCRRNLNSTVHSPMKSPHLSRQISNVMDPVDENEASHQHTITITDEAQKQQGIEGSSTMGVQSDRPQNQLEKFSRSHSTGHSMRKGEEDDHRFTLILSEELKSSIIRGHNSSKSWTSFDEYKDKNTLKNPRDAQTSGVSPGDDKV